MKGLRVMGETKLTLAPAEGSSVWRDHWASERLSCQSVRKMVRRESRTWRWKATVAALEAKFGRIEGLRTIELGAGKGDVSLLLALAGADVTLLDCEQGALERAVEQFACYDLTAKTIIGDLFNLDSGLLNQFDIAVSWGVVEHFHRPVAFKACLSHRRAVHDQGMVIISVPNAWSLPYRLNKWYREKRKTWKWGTELPFTVAELKSIGLRMGLRNIRVHGSPVVRDFDQFLFHPVMGRMEKYLGFELRSEALWTTFSGKHSPCSARHDGRY